MDITPAVLLLASTLAFAAPLVFAAVGELISEKAGVINIELDGMMLSGAFCGVWAALVSGSVTAGFVGAALGGTLVALAHGVLCLVFRAEQVVWGAVGALVGVVLGVLAMLFRGASALPVVLLVVCFAGAGIVGRDLWLTRAANQRERRMLAEFPTIAELLALAVSAGEGAIGALDRVCRLSRGELSSELGACLADARAGANLPTALQGLADRTGLTSLSRFVDGIVVAVERGTPLADVLRAQAQDVRESGRRAVMEEAGRKEIGMMVPVVFLILPVTVLFAIYPGVAFLRLAV